MFKIFVVLLFPLLIGSSDCNQFHDGTFIFYDFGSEFKIIRKGNKQIEYIDGEKQVFEYDVIWDSDCSYKLFNAKTIKGDVDVSAYDKDTLYCKIVDINKSTFKVICNDKGREAKTPLITKVK